jgi:hypothetical protein
LSTVLPLVVLSPDYLRGHFRITEMAPEVGEFEGSIPSIVKWNLSIPDSIHVRDLK